MATVDDFIKFLGRKPEKLGKIDCIFSNLKWDRDENGYTPMPAWYSIEMLQNLFKEDETNRFKQP